MKERHKWSKPKVNDFTEVQQCIKCSLYRLKALGRWIYSNQELTNDRPYVDHVYNEGCIKSE